MQIVVRFAGKVSDHKRIVHSKLGLKLNQITNHLNYLRDSKIFKEVDLPAYD